MQHFGMSMLWFWVCYIIVTLVGMLHTMFNIFVLPEYQGKGVGRKIIETLESDDYFLRAKRIEIPASITACPFYKKMGYSYKNGIDVIDEEQLFRLEKFR